MMVEEAHRSTLVLILSLANQSFLGKVVLQEEQAAVEVYTDECHQLKVKQLGLKVKEERTALEDVAKDLAKTILDYLVRVLN